MGCTVSKNVDTKVSLKMANQMRVGKSDLSLQHDPRLPLSAREMFSITKSWKAVSRDICATGTNMFIRLFETNEDIKLMFGKRFGKLNHTADVLQNSQLAQHATVVLCTIDDAITNLDDVDYVIEMLENVGRTHRMIKAFNPELIQRIEEPFLLAVKETLGDRYNTNNDKTYRRVIKFIQEHVINGYNSGDSISEPCPKSISENAC